MLHWKLHHEVGLGGSGTLSFFLIVYLITASLAPFPTPGVVYKYCWQPLRAGHMKRQYDRMVLIRSRLHHGKQRKIVTNIATVWIPEYG